MFNVSSHRRFGLTLAGGAAALLLSTSVMASGSFGGGGGVGLQNTYNLGKAVFHKKMVCDDCAVKSSKLDSMGAKELINKLMADKQFAQNVKGKNRKAVIVYLKRRYKAS